MIIPIQMPHNVNMSLLWCGFRHLKCKLITGSRKVTFCIQVDVKFKGMCIGVMHPGNALDRNPESSELSNCTFYDSYGDIYINDDRVTALISPYNRL
jgi:hypothetical protein